MFTVKRVCNGLESYVQADRVERRHGLNDDIAGVHLYVDHGQCDHPMGIIETGTVYVMNESGATVGVHRLGWLEPEAPAA